MKTRWSSHRSLSRRARCNCAGVFCAFGVSAFGTTASGADCSINSVTGVSFGTYNVFSSSNTDSMGQVTYQCSLLGAFDMVVIDLSTGQAGSYFPRAMLSGGHSLSYNLYRDAARTSIWGNGNGGTAHYGPVTLNLSPVTLQIYGRVPALQNAWVGSYSDTVVITMNF